VTTSAVAVDQVVVVEVLNVVMTVEGSVVAVPRVVAEGREEVPHADEMIVSSAMVDANFQRRRMG